MAKTVVDARLLQKIIKELEKASFFKYAKPKDIPTQKNKMIEYLCPFPMGCGRSFRADAENLSEQGVAEFLREIKTPLKAVGVELKSIAEEMDQECDGYTIIVDGERHQLCDAEELSRPPWEIVSAHAFVLLDNLLKKAHAEERVYCQFFGGNEQTAIFLTPRQFDILKRWPLNDRQQLLSSRQMLKQIS